MKCQSEFVTSYMGVWWARGLGGAREQALHNFPQFQHCSSVKGLQFPSWPFMTIDFYTKTTLHGCATLV